MKKLFEGSLFGNLFQETEIERLNTLQKSAKRINDTWTKSSNKYFKNWAEKEIKNDDKRDQRKKSKSAK